MINRIKKDPASRITRKKSLSYCIFRKKLQFLILTILFMGTILVFPVAAEQFFLQGHVYEGLAGDTSQPKGGVHIKVFGSRSPDSYDLSVRGVERASGMTDKGGYFSVPISYSLEFDPFTYYHLIIFKPAGYSVVSSNPLYGNKLTNEWTVYSRPVNDGAGGDFWIVRTIPPTASFSYHPTGMYAAPVQLSFIDTSTNNPTSWYWDFGDGSTSLLQNPSHTYNNAGNYSVTLTGSNPFGSTTAIKTIMVIDPLRADFTLSNVSGPAPLTVRITDNSYGNPISWSWTFTGPIGAGQGPINQRYLPVYVLGEPGTITITLTVMNAFGSNSMTKRIIVTPPARQTVADFTASPSNGQNPLTVLFTDTSTGNPTKWLWDFDDDGSYDTSVKNPEFTYNRTGMYSVRLNVYDEYGRSNTTVKTNLIRVGQRPPTLIPTVPTTTPVPTPLSCTFFSLPCEWIAAIIIIVAVIIAAVVIKPKEPHDSIYNTGSTGSKMLSELEVEPEVELVVRRGIEVTAKDFRDYGIRLDVDAGIEFPEEKDGKGG
jgi:PKD repeat protein